MKDWGLPIAALGVRPGHFSESEYYAASVESYQTYPVYHPDREPKGYWAWLQKQKAKPIVDASRMRSKEDWVRAGERIFREHDDPFSRSRDPKLVAAARDRANFEGVHVTREGYVLDRRWVVTPKGVELTSPACLTCHVRVEANGKFQQAGPGFTYPPGIEEIAPKNTSTLTPSFELFFAGENFSAGVWRAYATPWAPDSRVEAIRTMPADQVIGLFNGGDTSVAARFNGSPWYQTKIPDLHLLRYSRYIDATGTHRLRGAEDIARYAALVATADSMDFGEHRLLTDAQRKVLFRFSDEALYAMGVYLMALEPAKNPKPAPQEELRAGEKIFSREGCVNCHTPGDYTSGKLTLAMGYTPQEDHPEKENIVRVSVGTDSGLALKTRKGTGFYKIPSLRGVWYRPRLLHDGSVASLEEMFDPARLRPDHVPGGWKGVGGTSRGVSGHPFGLSLKASEKAMRLAFLRSL